MTDLLLISPDEIRTKIMSILYSHLDTKFTLNTLFNKLLENKYDKTEKMTNTIQFIQDSRKIYS
jgi:PBP1b-binding outer membrane lipoprotein LpoB